MNDLERFSRLYTERGSAHANRYCAVLHLIGSVCMSCGRAYRLVASQGPGGGLSHGWCSEACAAVGCRRAAETSNELWPIPH